MNAQFKGSFGLVIPKKKAEKKRPVIDPKSFDIEASEDTIVETLYAKTGAHKRAKLKAEAEASKVLETDPTAFAYDEVYDEIAQEREIAKREKILDSQVKRESKYIQKLKDKSIVRELDRQRAEDRKFEREQAKEAHLYGDKPVFVTGAHKKKMAEMRKWEAQRRVQEAEDEKNAVEKRGHMEGFLLNWSGIASGATARDTDTKYVQGGEVPAPAPAEEEGEQRLSSPTGAPDSETPALDSSAGPAPVEVAELTPEEKLARQAVAAREREEEARRKEEAARKSKEEREAKIAAAKQRLKERKAQQ